ncbi:MAG: transporter substrate-binding domain-containing protein, partial [Myxococcales bacterium]|nr:transporter substrate-binding domain-containing protein [Myxococcales bacterium]
MATALALTTVVPASASAIGDGPVEELVYGGDHAFPPYEFLDEDGEPAGLNVDLIRAVAHEKGFRVRIELLPWPE